MNSINVIGAETYVKDCPIERRWDLDVAEEQSEKIAKGCRKNYINIRFIQGKLVKTGNGEEIWLGDNLGRIAEGLSEGRIQLQQNESKKELADRKSWTLIPTKDAEGWTKVYVAYVYLGDNASAKLTQQAEQNPAKTLFEAGTIFPGQYVGLTDDLKLVIGDELKEVVGYIRGEKVKEL